MKISKYFIYILVALSISFFSCSDDDDSSTGPGGQSGVDQNLVGAWVLTKILAPIVTTPDVAGIALTAVFNADGTLQLTTVDADGTSIDAGTWSTANNMLTITLDGEDPGTSSYTVNGNTATINDFPVEFQGSIILASLEFTKAP